LLLFPLCIVVATATLAQVSGAAPVASSWATDPCGLAAGGRCPYGLVAGEQPLAGWPPPYSWPPLRAPLYKRPCPQAHTAPAGWPQPTAPVQGALAVTNRPFAGGLDHSRPPLIGGQAVVGRPCRRLGRGWPPILLLVAFGAKMQQERVERFYVIQSHHT
ncbi:hypothetical protein BHM03_00026087, partial [Ensete ventricosum]